MLFQCLQEVLADQEIKRTFLQPFNDMTALLCAISHSIIGLRKLKDKRKILIRAGGSCPVSMSLLYLLYERR